MPFKFSTFAAMLLALLFLPLTGFARDCSITPFQSPAADESRLKKGLVGKWDDSFEQNEITITDLDGKPMHYFSLQKQPANQEKKELIIFLHGFPEFAWAWEKQLAYFGERMHAVAIDLKGHHYSDAPEPVDEYSFIKLGWELRFIIQCSGYEQATIVGHDFGGGLAWTMGMLHPDVVKQLVILNTPHPYRLGRELLNPNGEQLKRSKYIEYAQGTASADIAHFNAIIFSDFSLFNSGFYGGTRLLRLMLENWLPTTRWSTMKKYYRAMPIPATEQEFPEHLSGMSAQIYRVKVPTLLLWGMKDPYFVHDLLNGMEDLVPKLEIKTYPDATHWINHEAADLNQQIELFMQKHGG